MILKRHCWICTKNTEVRHASDTSSTRDTSSRQSSVEGRMHNLRMGATTLLREALDADSRTLHQLPGRLGGAGLPGLRAGSLSVDQRYGAATEGASTVLGVHYSREPSTSLSGHFYGTGIKGAEAKRLSSSPTIKEDYGYASDNPPAGNAPTGRPSAEGRMHNLRMESTAFLREAIDADSRTLHQIGGGQQLRHRGPQVLRGVTSSSVRAAYGTAVEGAESVLGIHYSREHRSRTNREMSIFA